MANVTCNNQGTWDFTCPEPEGCGADGAPFRSTGWPSEEVAAARGDQHLGEHRHGALMQNLNTFREDHGLAHTPQDTTQDA